MGTLKKRQESAIGDLEQREKQAATSGSIAFQSFKRDSHESAVREGLEKGIITESDGTSSDTSDTSSEDDSSDGGDSGGDDFRGDDIPEPDAETPEDDTGDVEEETDEETPEEEPEADAEKEDKKGEEKARLESLRSLTMIQETPYQYRKESFIGSTGSSVAGSLTGEAFGFVISALAFVGLTAAPFLLKGLYKIVLFTFAQSFTILGYMFDSVEKRIEQYLNRTDKQKEQLAMLRKDLEQKTTDGIKYDPEQVIGCDLTYLSGRNDSLTENVLEHTGALNNQVKDFQKNIISEFNALRFIAKSRYLQKDFDAMKYMNLSPEKMGLVKTESLDEPGIFVDGYSLNTCIGNVSLVMSLPKKGLDTWENIEKAYKQSKVYLVSADEVSQQTKSKILSPSELKEFINSLESLIEASTQHQKLYEEILRQRSGVFNDVKALLVKLASESFKSSFQNSVALPLKLKSSFVTKVYVVGAMDLHDHTARVIANGLSFTSSMLKAYKSQA